MRRFFRHLPRTFLFLSTILFLLLASLAIKSYSRPDFLSWARASAYYIESDHGQIRFWHETVIYLTSERDDRFLPDYYDPLSSPSGGLMCQPLPRWPRWTNESLQRRGTAPASCYESRFGFSCETDVFTGSVGRNYEVTRLAIPYWLPLTISVIFPALFLTKRLLRKHPPPGHCQTCGYDLRATPARCPECGTTAPPTGHTHVPYNCRAT